MNTHKSLHVRGRVGYKLTLLNFTPGGACHRRDRRRTAAGETVTVITEPEVIAARLGRGAPGPARPAEVTVTDPVHHDPWQSVENVTCRARASEPWIRRRRVTTDDMAQPRFPGPCPRPRRPGTVTGSAASGQALRLRPGWQLDSEVPAAAAAAASLRAAATSVPLGN